MILRSTPLQHCERRGESAHDIRLRLNSCHDLVAAEARYHLIMIATNLSRAVTHQLMNIRGQLIKT